MAEIVNLRQARKAKAWAGKDDLATANRAKFGRTKAEREAEAAKAALAAKTLDGHKRDS